MDEHELIRRMVDIGWKGTRDVLLGPGDDAAVLRGGLVVCTDMMVEDVHFRFDWISAAEVGFRAAAAGLSDLAAMGADPVALLVSMALPSGSAVAEEIQRGLRRAGDRVAVSVIGGDLSRSPGPTVVDVVAVGRGRSPVRRSGAGPGQALWVSGSLGGAAAAVAAWRAGTEPDAAARERFVSPPDRVALGKALAEQGHALSMIDLSDGLVADARHIADQSGVQLSIEESLVPVDPAANGALNLALQGGEDYELLFTTESAAEARVEDLGRVLSVPLTRIGSVAEGSGVVLVGPRGRRSVTSGGGYDHFAE